VVYEFPSRALVHLPQYLHALPTRQAQSPFNGLDPSKPELDAVYIKPHTGLRRSPVPAESSLGPGNGSAQDAVVEADPEALSGYDR
jgi:hypothetical protein